MPIEKIENLIDNNGCISIASIDSSYNLSTAADEKQCLAMLVKSEGQHLMDLLRRLDAAMDDVYENQV